MTAQELRIGNLANVEGHIIKVDGRVICDYWAGEFKDVEGVPLTTEWLKAFGFKWKEASGRWVVGELKPPQYEYGLILFVDNSGFYHETRSRKIEFVHHLQNLYHGLNNLQDLPAPKQERLIELFKG